MVNIWKAAAGCDQLHHRFWKLKLSENWGLSLFTHLRENQAFGSTVEFQLSSSGGVEEYLGETTGLSTLNT